MQIPIIIRLEVKKKRIKKRVLAQKGQFVNLKKGRGLSYLKQTCRCCKVRVALTIWIGIRTEIDL